MDDFDRILANGWGTSIKGGAWTGTGTASNFAVAGGVGSMTRSAGGDTYAVAQLSERDVSRHDR